MTRHLVALLAALALALSVTASSHAGVSVKAPVVKQELPPSGPFPDAECNEDSYMDIYVAPDGVLWECVCEKMPSGKPACDWYDQGPVKASTRKRILAGRKVIRVKRGVLYVPRVRPVVA